MPSGWGVDPIKWNAQQLANARTIIRIGEQVGASKRDIAIALATAQQESELLNITGGDRDSAGLFQQRPSMGWGSYEQVTDPEYAARTFFLGKPGNPGLFSLKDRESMSLTQAAQKVQKSAYPDAYAKWEDDAYQLMGIPPEVAKEIKAPSYKDQRMDWIRNGGKGTPASPAAPPMPTPVPLPDALLKAGQKAAMPALPPEPVPIPAGVPGGPVATPGAAVGAPVGTTPGVPVGTTPGAPIGAGDVLDWQPLPDLPDIDLAEFRKAIYPSTPGTTFGEDGFIDPSRAVGVVGAAQSFIGVPYVWGGNGRDGIDCSGLVQQVYKSQGIDLPRVSAEQARSGARVGLGEMRVGDLVAWDVNERNGSGAEHIAIYIGNGQIIEAPRPGLATRVRKLDYEGYDRTAWGVRLAAAGG